MEREAGVKGVKGEEFSEGSTQRCEEEIENETGREREREREREGERRREGEAGERQEN